MAIYTKYSRQSGSIKYKRDGKLIARVDIPVPVRRQLRKLNKQGKVEDDLVPPYPPSRNEIRKHQEAEAKAALPLVPEKQCIYDGDETKLSRTVNGQIVYLCEVDYYDKSLGQLVQKIREISNVKQGEAQG